MNHLLDGKASVDTSPLPDLPGPDAQTLRGMRRRSGSEVAPRARIRVLVAHSDPLISAGLAVCLRERHDFEALVCSPALTTARAMRAHLPSADLVIADYDSGLRLLTSEAAGDHRVIILTHSDSEAKISHALKLGACGYLLLGCGLQELIDGLRSVHFGGISLGARAVRRIGDWMMQPTLTRREADVLRQLMRGLSNKAIAASLTVQVGTVKTHVKAIFNKLDALNRTEAVAIAQRRGILREERDCPPRETHPARITTRSAVRQLRAPAKGSRLAPSRSEFTGRDIGQAP